MYNDFFSLRKNPFNMTSDPACLYLTRQHREALAGLTYAVLEHKGMVVLTGDAGTGKTTLLGRTLQLLPATRVRSAVILNPTLTPSEFLELAMLDFGLTGPPASKAQRIARFQDFLLQSDQQGRVCVLVVDEAHKLSPEVLEEIRLLGNFEHADRKLLQILLIGQDELGEVLDREDLRQFKQRVALRFAIQALEAPEVSLYMQFRWTKAGGVQMPFSPEAVARIAQASRGIPRVINAVCDNALTLAFGEGTRLVSLAHVQEACTDLHVAPARELPKPKHLEAAVEPAPPLPLNGMRPLPRGGGNAKRSLLARWAGKLGLAQTAEPI